MTIRLIRVNTICHSASDFWLELFGKIVLSILKDGIVHFRYSGWKNWPFCLLCIINFRIHLLSHNVFYLVMLSATSPRWCMPGYWGNNCDKPGGIHCVDSIERETGRCFRCSPGYWGDNCNLLCPETCEIECIYPHELYSQVTNLRSHVLMHLCLVSEGWDLTIYVCVRPFVVLFVVYYRHWTLYFVLT